MRRKVQLWRFYDANDQPAPLLPASALHRFLVAQETAGADMAHMHEIDFETQLVAVPGTQPQFVLHRIRDRDLPSERRKGKIVDLNRRVQELAEGSHALFLQRNLVAFINTGFSPRPSRLAEWIRERIGWEVWLEPVLRPDIGNILDNLRRVSNIELVVSGDEVRRLDLAGFFEDEDDPLRTLLTAERAQQGGIIRVGWSIGQGGGANQDWFHNLVNRLRRADVHTFRTARATVYLDGADAAVPVDFIHDRIVAEVEIEQPTGRQRLLEPSVARDAMLQAWEHFKVEENVLKFVAKPHGDRPTVPDALLVHERE